MFVNHKTGVNMSSNPQKEKGAEEGAGICGVGEAEAEAALYANFLSPVNHDEVISSFCSQVDLQRQTTATNVCTSCEHSSIRALYCSNPHTACPSALVDILWRTNTDEKQCRLWKRVKRRDTRVCRADFSQLTLSPSTSST